MSDPTADLRAMYRSLGELPDAPAMFPYWDLDCAFAAGAAVAFGLMGMAEAIRRNHLRIMPVAFSRHVAGPITLEPLDADWHLEPDEMKL